ncbi:hypothetical protein [Sphingobium chungbukense]|uniref:hypothetical protein n=1 Tax=Sphingobium chungbukense TaxID=56193 RepID=UPI00069A2EBA|nr:hypothetical protein [Sphingobium chungbukense]
MSEPSFTANDRPRLVNWLWHRWYAKLYWLAFALFWMTLHAVWLLSLGSDFFRSTVSAYAMLIFNPITAFVVLGAGYIHALFSTGCLEWAEPAEGSYPFSRSLGGLNDPCSDPADPRSGINWIGSPQSRARRYGED